MDWQKHYDRLIKRARNRESEALTERHHVVPRCLGGGNEERNLVALTPEEHYIAHLILCRLHPGNQDLVVAVYLMATVANARLPMSDNKAVGWLRRKIIGVSRNAVVKAKLSEAAKVSQAALVARHELHARKIGVPRSDDTKAKVGAAHRGRKHSDEHRAAISAALKGKPKSAEHNAKVAAAATGRPGTRLGAVTSEVTKQKMRRAQLRRLYPDGVIPAKHVPDPANSARAHKTWATKRAKAQAEADKD